MSTKRITDRPNILLITTHDTGRHLGVYGRGVDTPAFACLAAEGVRFDRHFCTAPQCSPSRAALTTGRWPHSTGMLGLLGFGWSLPSDQVTLAKALGGAGYDTWLWGFQHEHEDPAALGYAHDPIGYRRGEVPKIGAGHVTPRLCDWLAGRPDGPFFASVGFFETHIPFPREPVDAETLSRTRAPAWLPDHPSVRLDVARLNRSVQTVDRCLGRILDALDSAALASNTLLVFTTDHGIAFPRAKCTLYDPGIEAALLMRWPDELPANRVACELVSNVDLMPTLLDLAGVPVPPTVQGRSLAGLLRGGTYEPRRELFAEMTWHDAYDPMRCVRTGRYKLIRRFDPLPRNVLPKSYWASCEGAGALRPLFADTPPEWELFDLAADPLELSNAADHPGYAAIRRQLADTLERWMRDTDDPLLRGPVPNPQEAAP
jgi:arylsulfatase A-like enzyme